MTETLVHLKPRDQWRPGLTLEQLRGEMTKAVQLPGVSTIWTMPIINRIDMLSTGVRTEVGVKVFGACASSAAETGAIPRHDAAVAAGDQAAPALQR